MILANASDFYFIAVFVVSCVFFLFYFILFHFNRFKLCGNAEKWLFFYHRKMIFSVRLSLQTVFQLNVACLAVNFCANRQDRSANHLNANFLLILFQFSFVSITFSISYNVFIHSTFFPFFAKE